MSQQDPDPTKFTRSIYLNRYFYHLKSSCGNHLSGCRLVAKWLPSGCQVVAKWLPSGCRLVAKVVARVVAKVKVVAKVVRSGCQRGCRSWVEAVAWLPWLPT